MSSFYQTNIEMCYLAAGVKKWGLSILLLVFSMGGVLAKSPVTEWQRRYGGTGVAKSDRELKVTQTADGGYIMASSTSATSGHVTDNHGDFDMWVVKTDALGEIVWKKSYGGSGVDYAKSIQQTTDGGYVIAGYSNSSNGDVSGGHGNYDFWVVKIAGDGTLEWQKTFGGTNEDRAYSIKQTPDGGYIVGGITTSSDGDVTDPKGSFDVWIVKLASTGSLDWQKTLGGTGIDFCYDLITTEDGGYLFTGYSNSVDGDVEGGQGSEDYWVVKLNDTGALTWQKTLGGTKSDISYSVKQAKDLGYIIAGETSSIDGDVSNAKGGNKSDYWIVKLNTGGALEWEKSYGGTNIDIAYSIELTLDGEYVIAGESSSPDGDVIGLHRGNGVDYSDFWIVRIDATGEIVWQKTWGSPGTDVGRYVQQTTSGGYIVIGFTDANTGGDKVLLPYPGSGFFALLKFSACPAYTSLTATICEGKNYDFNGTALTKAGEYKSTLQTVGGCDSIITLTLKVAPVSTGKLSAAICAGDSYDFIGTAYTNAGTYYKTLTAASGCDSIVELALTVNQLPVPVITANGNELSTGTFDAYEWFLDGQPIADATAATYTATVDGDYTVKVSNANTCSATSAIYIYKDIKTSISDGLINGAVQVYPNPVVDLLHIALADAPGLEVTVSSVNGNIVKYIKTESDKADISLSELPAGVYVLRIVAGETTMIRKVVRQ